MSDEREKIDALIRLQDEAEIRRYEARWSFYKVLFGTCIVGIVAAVLPYWIQLVQEDSKRVNDYRQFVTQYVDNRISQDIELRIRFAEYFSYLADQESTTAWATYHGELTKRRDTIRSEINRLEKESATLISEGGEELSEPDQIKLAELDRQLRWAYGEVGYAEEDTSIVQRDETLSTRDPNSGLAKTLVFGDGNPVIVLAVGHEPFRSNGFSPTLMMTEYEYNYPLAISVAEAIAEKGGTGIVLTREPMGATRHQAQMISERAGAFSPDFFLELHFNGSNAGASGTEIFTRGDSNREVAEKLLESVTNALGTRSRGVKDANFGILNRIEEQEINGALLELFFGDNERDARSAIENRTKLIEGLSSILTSI